MLFRNGLFGLSVWVALLAFLGGCAPPQAKNEITLLNVSYDPTRELFKEFNQAFSLYWKKKTGQTVKVLQSHGGSGKQARSIIHGLQGDVATLALSFDMDAIAAQTDILPPQWQSLLPEKSAPYTSTILFLVRKGNPKNIHDWEDLVQPGVSIITPNPKTSGGARWNYLAAWAYAAKKWGRDEEKIKEFMGALLRNVLVFDTGARGSTITFVERQLGDVFITWENEAFLATNELGKNRFEIVVPSISILAEPPVALLNQNTERHGTKKVAEAYLRYLYSEKGQKIAAKNYFRPRNPKIRRAYAAFFPELNLVTIDNAFGGWSAAHEKHFATGGTFDQIYSTGAKRS